MRLVVDTDPGTDDAHAISMASAHAREGIAGITTVAGNARVEQTTAAALYVIDRLGLDVPVFAGTAAPLLEPHHGALEIHGPDGLHARGATFPGISLYVLLAVVVSLRTSEGTLIVEVDDPEATIKVLNAEAQ